MNTIQEVLVTTPLFQGLAAEHLQQLASIANRRKVVKGTLVFLDGDDGNGFYLVCAGRVKIFKHSADGKEMILHIIEPGEPFGEVAVFSGRSFPASAETLMDCDLLFFDKQEFVRLIADNPSLSLNMMALLTQRLKRFAVQIEHLSLKEVPARLAHYFLYLMEEQENRTDFDLTVTKGQLASLLGTIPETLSRILTKMQTHRLVSVQGKHIEILDPSGLSLLAESGRFSLE